MHEKNKYRHIPWNRYNLEKYRDINFWSYRPALAEHIDSDNEEKQWRVNEGEASSFRPEHNPNKPHAIYKHL